MGKPIDVAIIVVYLAAMLAFGFWGRTRTRDSADFLVAGRLVAILGGFLWKRATGTAALWSMAVGTVVTLGTMIAVGDVLANEPIYYGLAASLIAYLVASLLTTPTPADVLRVWDDRLAGRDAETPERVAS